MDELEIRARALSAERSRPDSGERMGRTYGPSPVELLDQVIAVLAEALGSYRAGWTARDERVAEYDRLRSLGFTREQAADDIGICRATSYTYETLRPQQGAA